MRTIVLSFFVTSYILGSIWTRNDYICDFIMEWGTIEQTNPIINSNTRASDSIFIEITRKLLRESKNNERRNYYRSKIHQLKRECDNQGVYFTNNNSNRKNWKRTAYSHNPKINYGISSHSFSFPEPFVVDFTIPTQEEKILALSNIWNRFKFYYPHIQSIYTKNQYKLLLRSYVNKILTSQDLREYHLIIQELVSCYKDCHAKAESFIIDSFFGLRKPTIEVRYINNKVVVCQKLNSLKSFDSGLEVGDQITEIEDKKIEDYFNLNRMYVSASNTPSLYRELSNAIIRSNKSSLIMKIRRNNSTISISVPTYKLSDVANQKILLNDKPSLVAINDSVLLVKFGQAVPDSLERLLSTNHNIKWMICDLRSSTQYLLPVIEKHCYPEKTVFAFYATPIINGFGKLNDYQPLTIGYGNGPQKNSAIIPIILVNENTQSRGEFQALALQRTPNAITIGSQTAGSDGNVSTFLIPGNLTISMTTMKIVDYNKKETQRKGVHIDYYSQPTVDDIRNGVDTELQLALQLIQNHKLRR